MTNPKDNRVKEKMNKPTEPKKLFMHFPNGDFNVPYDHEALEWELTTACQGEAKITADEVKNSPHVKDVPKPTKLMEQKWEVRLNELGFTHPPLHQFIKNLIHKVREEAIDETKAEQNRVVNSGRKLFQEGQRFERERLTGKIENMEHDFNWKVHLSDVISLMKK